MPRRKLQPKPSISVRPRVAARRRPRLRPTRRPKRILRPYRPWPEQDSADTSILSDLIDYPGLWSDLFMITNTFDQTGSNTFKDFRLLCIDMKIMDIFRGFAEVRHRLEFAETVILRCKEMWLRSHTFEKQLTWFYCLCFMHLYQPRTLLAVTNLGVKIRLGINEYDAVNEFVSQADIQQVHDVDLLLEILLDDNAFLHCVTANPYGLDDCFLQYFIEDPEKSDYLSKTMPCPRLVYSLRKLKTKAKDALSEYCAAKEGLLSQCHPDGTRRYLAESLSNVKVDFIDQLFSCLCPDKQADNSSMPAEAGPSNSVQSRAGLSKRMQCLASPSNSVQSRAGLSKRMQCPAGPSNSVQSRAGPSKSVQSVAGL